MRRAAGALFALPLLAACGGHSEGYLAACHGEPLATIEEREQAQVEGYEIRPGYNCIDKQSWAAVQAQKAAWAAANTPEAKARRAAEENAARADAARVAAEREHTPAQVPPLLERQEPIDVSPVEANTASAARLSAVVSLTPEVVAQIVAARTQRPFADWGDLVARVTGLGAAQPAMFASVAGLTVNGESLSGAPPDANLAAQIRKRYRQP